MRPLLLEKFCFFLAFIVPCWAWAGVYRVAGETKDWTPSPGEALTYLLSIENPDNYTVELVAGWSLKLRIQPESGAQGSVRFLSALTPQENYLFAGRSGGLIPPFLGPSESIDLISDLDNQLTGLAVPQAGKSLLQVELTASPDAAGRFRIEVEPGSDYSYWMYLDAVALEGVPVAFENVPFAAKNVPVGSVTIVAEPESATLVLVAAVLGPALFWLRKIRPASGDLQVIPRNL